ncbi:methylated-DNA--[protein]-cysteine S-methyltransferase [Oceaniglobus trochenteri]|uniref:methylated-DNA--[protein]-cysteine S-methyltransferase n=1 Tax=Oceaniglobus trochenteri TaxID=2763260 RepID=UPI001CFFAB21|nr:bifunctional helix-turn-helix domain-containing protein/methylated-DNA--[protein]-cysteine S-methyltransferase [Oceaniglobus trochenteri]
MSDIEQSYYWPLMRRAIERLDAPEGRDLTLEDIARDMNLSPAHFQRVFSRWVGISPKRFQQYLRLGHAKTLLRDRHTTLATADAVGLSGNARLHDLFLRWESMSPGDFARQGAELTIRHGLFDSPFGPALVLGTERGICGMAFTAETGEAAARDDLMARWPRATFREDAGMLRPWVRSAFGAAAGDDPTPLYLIGAPFQLQVWEALLTVPTGHVTTYGDIAQSIGNPKAVRAVGTAVGRNPVSWLIPCHRALRKSGGLGGYHWGLPVKRAMLAHESAVTDL